MFSYENGIILAFLLWLGGTTYAIVSINSMFERNLNKIGQRLSWLTLTPQAMEPDDIRRSTAMKVVRFAFIAGLGLVFVLLSWLYVTWFIGVTAYKLSKDIGAPQIIKEFRWKLRNVDLSFDQLVRELMKINEKDPSEFENIRGALIQEMEDRGLHAPR